MSKVKKVLVPGRSPVFRGDGFERQVESRACVMASFDSNVPAPEPPAAAPPSNTSISRRDYIAAELEQVRALFPAPMIQAANSSFVQVIVM